MGHIVAKAYGHDMRGLLKSRSIAEQRQFFEDKIAPLFERKLVKWVTERRVSLYGLGIPPAQYEALSGGEPMQVVLKARLERLVCDFPLRENYFAWQAFGRAYAPGASGPLPLYLQERYFAQLRLKSDRVDAGTLAHWNYLEARSAELGANDRSAIYGGFHVYELAQSH